MELASAQRKAALAVVLGFFLFFFTGWIASEDHVVIDWSSFQLDSALVFLGAYAQLVLAAAVFFQIRAADRAVIRQIAADLERGRRDKAEALMNLVAVAANARSVYVGAIPALRNVAYSHGQQAALDRAEAELLPADRLRQQAHAARIRIEALFAEDLEIVEAARSMTKALDVQRQRSRSVLAWSRTAQRAGESAPDPQEAAQFAAEAQEYLLARATDLLGAADVQGPPPPSA